MPNICIGHKKQFELLRQALINKRSPHAYLFHGAPGSGINAFALKAAMGFLCEQGDMSLCGQCYNCRQNETLRNPDLRILMPTRHESGSNPGVDLEVYQAQLTALVTNPWESIIPPNGGHISIEDIRSLKREASLSPGRGDIRIFLMLNIEDMGNEAANSLLKLLEEPPPSVKLLLTTTAVDSILPTIRSRCQVVGLPPLVQDDLLEVMQTYHGDVDEKRLRSIVALAEGDYVRAAAFLDDNLEADQDLVLQFLRHAFRRDPVAINQMINVLHNRKDQSQLLRFMRLLIAWFRDQLMLRMDETGEDQVVFFTQLKPLRDFAANFPDLNIEEALNISERHLRDIEHNGYIPLVITSLALDLGELLARSRGERRAV